MRRFKTWGSIAIVAIFAMALLGPSSAMGESTALCEADEESECASSISHIHYVDDHLEILTPEMTYHCNALFLASVSELGKPQVLEGNFTYTNCNNGCSRAEENGPTILDLYKTGHESAELTYDEAAESGIHSSCEGFINCLYSFKGLTGYVKGPLLATEENGEIVYQNQVLTKIKGLLCPTYAKLHARFVPLSPAYISS